MLSKPLCSLLLAVRTRLELATPCVIGMYSNQLNYRTILSSSLFTSPSNHFAKIQPFLKLPKLFGWKIHLQGSDEGRHCLFSISSPDSWFLKETTLNLYQIQLLWFSKSQQLRTRYQKIWGWYLCFWKRNHSAGRWVRFELSRLQKQQDARWYFTFIYDVLQ